MAISAELSLEQNQLRLNRLTELCYAIMTNDT